MSSAPEVNTARIGRQKAVSRQAGAPEAPRAGQSLGARIAARAGGGVMRVFLVLVALFWLMPTIGLLLSSLRGPQDIAATGW
ncbi:alpha-glucoside transport system permease protein, partial [Streptomyces sp. OspMP-M43]